MPASKSKATDYSALEAQILPVSESKDGTCWMLYGRSGTGKTTVAATFPKPLLLLDMKEKGTDSIFNVKGVEIINVKSWSKFEEIYWYLKSGKPKYKSVVVDTLTQAQDLALVKALKDDGKESTEQVSKRNFGQASGLLKTWITNYRDLIESGMNLCFIAQDRTFSGQEELEGGDLAPEVGPRLMPSVASHANAAVKLIGHTFIRERITRPEKGKLKTVREVLYGLRVGPHAYYVTKIRIPKEFEKPDIIYDPTFDKVIKVIRGDQSSNKPTRRK